MTSPLHIAARTNGLSTMIALLIEVGFFNIEKRDKKGRTPLLRAAQFCCTENIQLLLQYSAAPDAVDCDGNSAFHYLIHSLPSFYTNTQSTALTALQRSPIKNRRLVPAGQTLPANSLSSSSSPSTECGSAADVISALQLLIDSGADVKMTNNLDETCLDLLSRKSKKCCPSKSEVSLFLKSHGAKSSKDLVQSGKSKGKLRGLLGL